MKTQPKLLTDEVLKKISLALHEVIPTAMPWQHDILFAIAMIESPDHHAEVISNIENRQATRLLLAMAAAEMGNGDDHDDMWQVPDKKPHDEN